MYLDAYRSDDFYTETAREMWGDSIKPSLSMFSNEQLERELEEGKKLWIRLHPPKDSLMSGFGGLAIFAAVAVTAGAASMAMGAGAAGAGAAGAGAASGGASAAAGAASAASGGALSAGKALALVAKGADYLKKGAATYTAVTGKETPSELMAAADIVENSDDWTEASEKAFQYYLKQSGQEMADDKQKALIRERLKREQGAQAERIRALARRKAAEQQRQATGQTLDYWPLLIPAGLIVAMGVM